MSVLYTIIVVLIALWIIGLATSYTLGGLIHTLLVFALVIFVLNVIRGRRT